MGVVYYDAAQVTAPEILLAAMHPRIGGRKPLNLQTAKKACLDPRSAIREAYKPKLPPNRDWQDGARV